MRYTWPKKKLCKREWVNLFWTEKYDLSKSNTNFRPKKLSEYWLQLRKKQLAKRMYGISEKQFLWYYKKASNSKWNWTTWEKMLSLLELRLDNVVYRANFARTRMQSRQFVWHAHFKLNWVKVDVPSISLKVWDVIELRDKLKESPLYKDLIEELNEFSKQNKWVVSKTKWIEVDPKNIKITIKALPGNDDFDQIIDIQKIIEFYSK